MKYKYIKNTKYIKYIKNIKYIRSYLKILLSTDYEY